MYSISEIVKRYNDSVSDYTSYLAALNEHLVDEQEQHLRNAGEGLSQTLELALKLHVQTMDPNTSTFKINTPSIISKYYLDDFGNKQSLYYRTVGIDIVPTVDFGYLKSNKYYLTNASKHDGDSVDPGVVEQYIEQCKRFILEYLNKQAQLRNVSYYMAVPQDNIQQFYVACDHFQRQDRTYILLTTKINDVDKHYYSHFSYAPWDIIIDFNRRSMENGFGSGAYHGGGSIAHIFKAGDIMTADDFSSSMRKPVYFFANGFKNEKSFDNYEDWNRIYYSKLERFLQLVAQDNVGQKTIVVSLLDDEDYIENLRTMIGRYFTNVKCVIANDIKDKLLGLAKRKSDNYEHTKTTIQEMDRCFKEYLNISNVPEEQPESFSIPFIQGEGNGILSKAELQDMEECFEVLYLGVGEGSDENCESFLCGEVPLSWQGVKRGFAAKRERFQKMYVKPLETEIRKGRSKIYIVHEAGFGGSTVARQLAYAFHDSYPVLYLKKYRNKAVLQKLDWLHERTKKTIIVFMEIPSVISADDFEYLYSSSNQSRPYVFVGIKRGIPKTSDISVTDWGIDSIFLSDTFKPIIEKRYVGNKRTEKLDEIQRITLGNAEPYQRTPFYYGLLSYEEDFMAANSFFEKFVEAINGSEVQRRCLIYLSVCDAYADKPLPEAFFKTVFGVDKKTIFKLEQFFNEEDGVFSSLILPEKQDHTNYFRPKYAFFSKMLMQKLLRKENTPEDMGWRENLGLYCKKLIEEAANSSVAKLMQNEVLQPLFIGTSKEREGDKFTDLVEDVQEEERINIFTTLHEQFPDNPHFCSHLARYYAMKERDMQKALEYADRAIHLSEAPDPLLHHMKGMCLYYIINDRIERVKKALKNVSPDPEEISYITNTLLAQAEMEFLKSREIQQQTHHEDEYGYIPNIKMLLRIFDFYVYVNGETKRNVIALAKEPYIGWLDKAQSLLDNVRRLHEEGEESEFFIQCETSLWAEYGDFKGLVEKLNNQLVTSSHPALVRRQLAQIYMRRSDDYKSSQKANNRILELMNDNMRNDSTNISNFLLWFKAARYSSLSIDEILVKLAQWKATNPAIDLAFYSYVFNAIKAIEGSSEAAILAKKYIQECRMMGGGNRIYIKEWYGDAPQRILSNAEKKENSQIHKLYDVTGYVKEFQHPGNAIIELDCGLDVFFKPSISGLTSTCLNHNVKFHLGFSYDGLRAENESVKIAD